MPETVLENVQGSNLPPDILKKMGATKYHTFTISLEGQKEMEFDDDGNPMPPESAFKDEFIQSIEAAEGSFEKGEGTLCHSKEEREKLFNQILSEDDD